MEIGGNDVVCEVGDVSGELEPGAGETQRADAQVLRAARARLERRRLADRLRTCVAAAGARCRRHGGDVEADGHAVTDAQVNVLFRLHRQLIDAALYLCAVDVGAAHRPLLHVLRDDFSTNVGFLVFVRFANAQLALVPELHFSHRHGQSDVMRFGPVRFFGCGEREFFDVQNEIACDVHVVALVSAEHVALGVERPAHVDGRLGPGPGRFLRVTVTETGFGSRGAESNFVGD